MNLTSASAKYHGIGPAPLGGSHVPCRRHTRADYLPHSSIVLTPIHTYKCVQGDAPDRRVLRTSCGWPNRVRANLCNPVDTADQVCLHTNEDIVCRLTWWPSVTFMESRSMLDEASVEGGWLAESAIQ
jgi:hypothetical protein